jgi:hypothetical protein
MKTNNNNNTTTNNNNNNIPPSESSYQKHPPYSFSISYKKSASEQENTSRVIGLPSSSIRREWE